MSDQPNRPWWADHIPDIRDTATAAMFGIVVYMLWLIANYPELGHNELFKTVATLLIGSGAFGLVCAFLWGGSKASVAAADTVNRMAQVQPPPASPTVIPPTPATVESPADSAKGS